MISGPPRGIRDFYPEDVRLRNWLFSLWREVSESFGFQEYDGPVVESEELYIRKSGEEIVGQLYNFEDKGGRRLALRPEMTPTLARMIIARGSSLPKPIKWFSIPQCFRYERMSKGRRREHYQWNLDIVGAEEPTAEAEVIAAAIEFLKTRHPRSLRVCALLDKAERREIQVPIDYVGFVIPDKFVFGYGLDLDELYRNLPFIGTVNPARYHPDG